jgi:hypothetical protein
MRRLPGDGPGGLVVEPEASMAKKEPKTFEQVHGVGPLWPPHALDENSGRIPTQKIVDRATGQVMTLNAEDVDEDLHADAPAHAAPGDVIHKRGAADKPSAAKKGAGGKKGTAKATAAEHAEAKRDDESK